jgi:hypothetical protein
MSNITYQTILKLINNINSFAEQADQNINSYGIIIIILSAV